MAEELLHQVKWQSSHNDISVEASMDIKVRPANSKRVVLFVPGVDGSVDGYMNKYINASDHLVNNHDVGIVRISNDFISSFHWEDNIKQALKFLEDNASKYFSSDDLEISVVGHSAGASVTAAIAHKYPAIRQILLINAAKGLNTDQILEGLSKFDGKLVVVYGSDDPSNDFISDIKKVKPNSITHIIDGADHHFTGEYIRTFEKLPLLLYS